MALLKQIRFKWLLLFVLSYLLFMLLLMPVRWLYAQGANRLPAVAAIEGTLWQGAVSDLQLPARLRQLQWQWRPAAMLSGAWGYRVDLDRPGNGVELTLSWQQNLTAEQLQLRGRLSDWVSQFHDASIPFDVDVELSAERLELSRQGCVEIDQAWATVSQWRGLMADTLNQLGELSVALSCVDGTMVADLSAEHSQLSGSWRLLPDRSYQLDVSVAAPSDQLRESLQLVGFSGSVGMMRYRYQGRL